MKHLLLSLAIFISFFGCRTERDLIYSDSEIRGSYLNVDGSKNYLPPQLLKDTKILYKSKTGIKKTLSATFSLSTIEGLHKGFSFNKEKITIYFIDEIDTSFSAVISGNSDYTEENKIAHSVSITLMPTTKYWSSGKIAVNDKGVYLKHEFSKFSEKLMLNGVEFQNCIAFGNPKLDAFSEFYLNSENGLVAFRDKTNELFVFEKFDL